MKNYQKAQMIAKNLPTGSYAAGCPGQFRQNQASHPDDPKCRQCETAW